MAGMLTRAQAEEALERLGIACGDHVYVHSALRRIGPIEGGADTLIDAFLAKLGPEGTLAVPTHTLNFEARGTGAYDPAATPTVLGTFPELVRRRPEAYRSGHASHSSAAIGRLAAHLTQGHRADDALHEDSPLHRLYRAGGKVVLLGVGHTANTALHLAESVARLPYIRLPYDASWGEYTLSLDEHGHTVRTRQTEYPGCSDRFDLIEGFLWIRGAVRYGMLGGAHCQCVDIRGQTEIACEVLQKRPDFFLCLEPDCPCCVPRRAMMAREEKREG